MRTSLGRWGIHFGGVDLGGPDESRTDKVTKVAARRPGGPIEALETSAGGPGASSVVLGSARRVARNA